MSMAKRKKTENMNPGALLEGMISKPKKKRRRSADSFTEDDLLAGLRASAEGTPVEGFLPSSAWEEYTASLLNVLFDKHLLFPSEIERAFIHKKKTSEKDQS